MISKIKKNFDFGQNFKKFDFDQNFSKNFNFNQI